MFLLAATFSMSLLVSAIGSLGNYEFEENTPIGSTLDVSGSFPVSTSDVVLIPSSDGVDYSSWFSISLVNEAESETGSGNGIDGGKSSTGRLRLATLAIIDRERFCDSSAIHCGLRLTALVNGAAVVEFVVFVLDVNDCRPSFESISGSAVTVYASEAATEGTKIELPVANDADSPSNGIAGYRLTYSAASRSAGDTPFSLIDADGSHAPSLQITSPLDRESVAVYRLRLTAYDVGNLTSDHLAIGVEVADVDDNSPRFPSPRQPDVVVEEDTAEGSVLATLRAYDADHAPTVSYALAGGAASRGFSVQSGTGVLFLRRSLDFESARRHSLVVRAYSGNEAPATPEVQSTTRIDIVVTDVNDNRPTLLLFPIDGFRVAEDADDGKAIAVVTASDKDSGTFGQFECNISPNTSDFRLKPLKQQQQQIGKRYLIVPRRRLDIDFRKSQRLRITCIDGGGLVSGSKYLRPDIIDVNDNKPIFSEDMYSSTVAENHVPLEPLLTVIALDHDSTSRNNRITFEFTGATNSGFRLNPDTGEIFLRKALDREVTPVIKFTVIARDSGIPSLTSRTEVTVTVTDENDNYPHFRFSDDENETFFTVGLPYTPTSPSKAVFKLRCTDPDWNDTLTYSLAGQTPETPAFSLTARVGELHLEAYGASAITLINLTVQVEDSVGHVTRARLYATLLPVGGGETNNGSDSSSLALAVSLAVVAVILTIGLAIALVIWRRRRGKCNGESKSNAGLNNSVRVEYISSTYYEKDDCIDVKQMNPLHSTPKDNVSVDSGNGHSQDIDTTRDSVAAAAARIHEHAFISQELGELASQAFQLGKQRMAKSASVRTPQLGAHHDSVSPLPIDITEINGEDIYISSLQSRV